MSVCILAAVVVRAQCKSISEHIHPMYDPETYQEQCIYGPQFIASLGKQNTNLVCSESALTTSAFKQNVIDSGGWSPGDASTPCITYATDVRREGLRRVWTRLYILSLNLEDGDKWNRILDTIQARGTCCGFEPPQSCYFTRLEACPSHEIDEKTEFYTLMCCLGQGSVGSRRGSLHRRNRATFGKFEEIQSGALAVHTIYLQESAKI